MKIKSIFFLSIIFSLFVFEKTFSKAFFIGQIVNDELKISSSFKLKLPKGNWEVVRKSADTSYGIKQRIVGIVRVENNEVVEAIEVYEGLLAGIYQSAVNQIIYEIIFKNKYDGCYERPEYYYLGLFKKGSTHNCMVIGHWDVEKELNNPDDPEKRGVGASYNKWMRINNYKFSPISLVSLHSYFSRTVKGNWYQIRYIVNPKMLNAPKNNFRTEESSEYHKYNIDNFPDHKKTMEEFIRLSFQRHKDFENIVKARGYHRLKFEDLK